MANPERNERKVVSQSLALNNSVYENIVLMMNLMANESRPDARVVRALESLLNQLHRAALQLPEPLKQQVGQISLDTSIDVLRHLALCVKHGFYAQSLQIQDFDAAIANYDLARHIDLRHSISTSPMPFCTPPRSAPPPAQPPAPSQTDSQQGD